MMCVNFFGTFYHEICKNNDLYKEIIMHQQEQAMWDMREDKKRIIIMKKRHLENYILKKTKRL